MTNDDVLTRIKLMLESNEQVSISVAAVGENLNLITLDKDTHNTFFTETTKKVTPGYTPGAQAKFIDANNTARRYFNTFSVDLAEVKKMQPSFDSQIDWKRVLRKNYNEEIVITTTPHNINAVITPKKSLDIKKYSVDSGACILTYYDLGEGNGSIVSAYAKKDVSAPYHKGAKITALSNCITYECMPSLRMGTIAKYDTITTDSLIRIFFNANATTAYHTDLQVPANMLEVDMDANEYNMVMDLVETFELLKEDK